MLDNQCATSERFNERDLYSRELVCAPKVADNSVVDLVKRFAGCATPIEGRAGKEPDFSFAVAPRNGP